MADHTQENQEAPAPGLLELVLLFLMMIARMVTVQGQRQGRDRQVRAQSGDPTSEYKEEGAKLVRKPLTEEEKARLKKQMGDIETTTEEDPSESDSRNTRPRRDTDTSKHTTDRKNRDARKKRRKR